MPPNFCSSSLVMINCLNKSLPLIDFLSTFRYDYVTPEHPKPPSSNGKRNGNASVEDQNLKLVRDNSEHSVLRGINREVSTMSSIAPLASQEHIELHVKD